MNNPLQSARAPGPQDDLGMMAHARIWQHVNQQPDDTLTDNVKFMDYALPIMAQLASNPKVKAKDVIKAVSSAAADEKISPSQAVAFVTQIPADPDKLRSWLMNMYSTSLAATVHAKAALMQRAQQGQSPQQMPPQGAPAPAMPMPAAPMPGGPQQ